MPPVRSSDALGMPIHLGRLRNLSPAGRLDRPKTAHLVTGGTPTTTRTVLSMEFVPHRFEGKAIGARQSQWRCRSVIEGFLSQPDSAGRSRAGHGNAFRSLGARLSIADCLVFPNRPRSPAVSVATRPLFQSLLQRLTCARIVCASSPGRRAHQEARDIARPDRKR